MVLDVHWRAISIFTHHRDAEQVLHELKDLGFGNG